MTRASLRPARAVTTIVAGAMIVAACYTSPKPRDIPHATSPFGASATISVAFGRSYDGELLAVSDTALVLLINRRVATVRPAAVATMRVTGVGNVKYEAGRATSTTQRDRAQLVARFPWGIPPAAMAALLAKSGQQAPDDLEAAKE